MLQISTGKHRWRARCLFLNLLQTAQGYPAPGLPNSLILKLYDFSDPPNKSLIKKKGFFLTLHALTRYKPHIHILVSQSSL